MLSINKTMISTTLFYLSGIEVMKIDFAYLPFFNNYKTHAISPST